MGTVDREIHDGILRKVAEAPWGEIPIQCNLLVVEPEPGRVWAIGYINDKALGRAESRREKVNILRVLGWLCQEKVLRRPERMTAVVAELLPRWNLYAAHIGLETGPEMFSPSTWWSHERLWEFIGVPYGVVEIAIDDVGQTLRDELMGRLATILPRADR